MTSKCKMLCHLMVLAGATMGLSAWAGTCTINVTANSQTIDGFGFSSAWCGVLSSAKNNAMYNTLGMSLLRVRIDENTNWSEETANATAAHNAGVKVLGTCWMVPTAWRSSSGGLNFTYAANYANWLKSAANSIGIDNVSFINEPDGTGKFSPTDILNFVKNNCPAIGKPIVMPEAIGFSDSYSDPTINDSTAVNNFTYLGGHLYGGGLTVHQNALNHGKHVWMTEYYWDGNDIGTCVNIAKQISDCMNDQMSAYYWWWDNDNDTATLLVNSSGTIFKNGYTIGQFAKYVRPGKIRCSSTYNPSSNVYVTAYHSGGVVVVAINTGTSSVSQPFSFQNVSGLSSMSVNRTSSSENMASVGSVTVANNAFTYTLPAQSITTFHQY